MAWLKPELNKEREQERKRREQVGIATEKLRREHVRRALNSRRNYITNWQGFRHSVVLNLIFWIAGVNGKFHPDMSTLTELDPQFECSRETLVAYASEIYDLPKPATSNNSTKPGHLCTFAQHATFSEMVAAVMDSGGSCCMAPSTKDFMPDSLRPSNNVVRCYNGELKANLQEGTLD
jgi:hypothetical protein